MELTEHVLIKLYQASNHFGHLLEMELSISEPGDVEYRMIIREKHLATLNAAHGGAISALVDGALGVSALSLVCHEMKVVSTIELKLNYLKPALLGDELKAHGRVIHAGRRILSSECRVYNQRGELMATASGTFNAYPAEKVYPNLVQKSN